MILLFLEPFIMFYMTVSSGVTDVWQYDHDITLTLTLDFKIENKKQIEKKIKMKRKIKRNLGSKFASLIL